MANDDVIIDVDIEVNSNAANSQVANITKSFSSMQKELELLNRQFEKSPENYKGNILKLREAFKNFSPELSSSAESVQSFFDSFGSKSRAYSESISQAQKYRNELAKLREEESKFSTAVSTGKTTIGDPEDIERAETAYKEASRIVDEYRAKVESVQTSLADTKSQKGSIEFKIDTLKNKLVDAKSRLDANAMSQMQYNKTVYETNKELSKYEAMLGRINARRKHLSGVGAGARANLNIAQLKQAEEFKNLQNLQAPRLLNEEELASAKSALAEISQEIETIQEKLSQTPTDGMSFVGQRLEEAASRGEEAFNKVFEEYVNGVNNADSASIRLNEMLTEIKQRMGTVKTERPMDNASDSANKASNSISKLNSHTSNTHRSFKLLHKLASSLKGVFSKMFGEMRKGTSLGNINFKKLGKTFIQFGLGVRSLYFLIRKMRTEFMNGMKQLAGAFPDINTQISGLAMSFNQLKGSLISMVQPVASYVIPILTRLFNLLSALASQVGQFFAVLTGQNVIYKATAANVDYAGSIDDVGGSAKEANKELAEYDNLLVIPQDNAGSGGGGGGGGGDLGYTFDEEPVEAISEFARKLKEAWSNADFEGVGIVLADKLNELTAIFDEWILNTLEPKSKYWASAIARILNGLFSEWDADLAGKTLKDLINTVLEAIDTAITTFDWKLAGQRLGEFFQGIFGDGSIGTNVGKTLGDTLHGILTGAIEFLRSDPGGAIGKNVANFITELFNSNKNGEFGTAAGNIINNINSFITNTFSNVSWKEIGRSLLKNITTMLDEIDTDEIGKSVASALSGITDVIWSAIDYLTMPDESGKSGIARVINFIVDTICALIENIDITGITKSIGSLSVRILASVPPIAVNLVSGIMKIIGNALNQFFPQMGDGMISMANDLNTLLADEMYSQIVNPFADWVDSYLLETERLSSESHVDMENIQQDYRNTKDTLNNITGSITSDFDTISESSSNMATSTVNSSQLASGGAQKYANENKVAESTIVNSNKNIQNSSSETSDVLSKNYQSSSTVSAKYTREEMRNREDLEKVNRDMISSGDSLRSSTETNFGKMGSASATHRTNMLKMSVDTKAKYAEISKSASDTATSIGNAYQSKNWSKIGSDVSANIGNGVENNRNWLVNKTNSIASSMSSSFSRNWYSIGDNIMTGIGNGINGAWNWLTNKVRNVASSLLNSAKSALNIHSPSKAFETEVGFNIDYGIGNGVENAKGFILNKLDDVATSMIDEFSDVNLTPSEMFSFNALNKSFDGFIDTVVNKFETMLNKLEDLAGKFTFRLPSIAATMPNIARGSIVPNNAEFSRAITASNDSMSTVQQLMDALSQNQGSLMPERIQVVLPSGRVLAETVWDEERKLFKQTGHSSPKFA